MSLTHFFINYYYSHYTHSLGLPSQREPSSLLFLAKPSRSSLSVPRFATTISVSAVIPGGSTTACQVFSSWALISPWSRWVSFREWDGFCSLPYDPLLSGIPATTKGLRPPPWLLVSDLGIPPCFLVDSPPWPSGLYRFCPSLARHGGRAGWIPVAAGYPPRSCARLTCGWLRFAG